MNGNFSKASDEFRQNASAKKMLLQSFKVLLPTKGNTVGFLISLLVAAVFARIVGFSDNTIEMVSSTANTILNVQIGLFSVVLTVYSIIFVFFDDEKLKLFARVQDNKNSTFISVTAEFYHAVLFLYFINIAVTGLIVMIMDVFPADFRLTGDYYFDTYLASLLLLAYYWFSFRAFYELKSVIFNTIQLFRIGILMRLISFTENTESDTDEGRTDGNEHK